MSFHIEDMLAAYPPPPEARQQCYTCWRTNERHKLQRLADGRYRCDSCAVDQRLRGEMERQ